MSKNDDFKATAHKAADACEQWDIRAPWGTLSIIDGDIHGFPGSLMLPNISISPSFARVIAEQLLMAAEKAELTDKPRTAGEMERARNVRKAAGGADGL